MTQHVYFAERNGLIKIGTTRHLGQRMDELGARLITATQGRTMHERAIHKMLADHATGGEWFRPHPDVWSVIMDVVLGRGDAVIAKAMTFTAQTREKRADTSDWISVRDAARVLAVHPETLKRWADLGEIPSMRTPGGWRRFRKTDVDAFIDARRTTEVPS